MVVVAEPRVIQLPDRSLTKGKRVTLTERKRPPRKRVILSVDLPRVAGPTPGHEAWVERFERAHRFGHPLHNQLIQEDDQVPTIITLPRKVREGSFTDEQIAELHAAIMELDTNSRAAVVVCEDMGSENSARNKARAFALLHEDEYPTIPDPENEGETITNPRRYLTAHAIKGENNKWIGAVTVRAVQKSKREDDDTTENTENTDQAAPKQAPKRTPKQA